MTHFIFVRTLWKGAIRREKTLPEGQYLLPISSWYGAGSQTSSGLLPVPRLPASLCYGVDCGAYRYTRTGDYPFAVHDYIRWCQSLNPGPQWVVMPDWFASGFTGQEPYGGLWSLAEVLSQALPQRAIPITNQVRTILLSYLLWDHFRDAVSCWSPVVSGRKELDYLWHAQAIEPLVRDMQAHYGNNSPFRLGIGSLVGRPSAEIENIIAMVSTVVPNVPLHLFGFKLRALQQMRMPFPSSIPWVSADSSLWHGARSKRQKAWRESGLTRLDYAFQVGLPDYEWRLGLAWERLQTRLQSPLPLTYQKADVDKFLALLGILRVQLQTAKQRSSLHALFSSPGGQTTSGVYDN